MWLLVELSISVPYGKTRPCLILLYFSLPGREKKREKRERKIAKDERKNETDRHPGR